MHRTAHSRVAFAAGLLLIIATARPSSAQTGSFVPSQTYWMGPIGGAGVEILSGQIWVDVNGNDLNDPGDTFHPIPAGLATGWDFRLTPSRRYMVAFTSDGSPCPATPASIRLYSIPTLNGASLVQLGTQQTLSRCIQQVGFSDDPANAVRTGFWREAPHPTSGEAEILWWDLVTGVAGTSAFPYDANFGFVDFAPSGTMAWVQHGINAPQGTKYSLVELCPATIGLASQPGLTNQTAILRASVEVVTGGGLGVVIRDGTTVVATMDYEDCALPPPVTGACCLPGGGCLGGTTQPECETDLGGTWQGASTSCTPSPCPPPPAPLLAVAMTGPPSVELGAEFSYTLTARNDGTLAAGSVVVTDSLPLGLVFVSASAGGTYDGFSRKVAWSLGTLGQGAQQALTLTVSAPCSGTQVVNDTYGITGAPGGTVAGSPAVTTSLTAPPTTPLAIVLASQALAPTPLVTGNRVRHTVQLTNTLAQARPNLRMSFQPGLSSDIVQIVDTGGGTVTDFGGLKQWNGTIGANATIQIVWETAIKECRGDAPSTEVMNRGVFIVVTHKCGGGLGFATPTRSFPVAPRPVAMRLDSPSHGPAQTWASTTPKSTLLARPGATIDFELRMIHAGTETPPACQASFSFPAELAPAGDPPFIGSPPAGTTWDPGTQTIAWSGQPPANDSVVVAFRGTLGGSACLASLQAPGSYGNCANALLRSLDVAGVPAPPAGAHLIGLQTNGGLWAWPPGGSQWQPLLCGSFYQLRGVGRTPDGTLWVAGTPTFSLNAATLGFQVFSNAFLQTLQIDFPFDVAGDPRDSSVVFVGYQTGLGLRVRRYNPRTGVVTSILNDTSPLTFGVGNSVVVSPDGVIGVQYQGGVLRIDPANPAAYQVFTDPSVPQLSSLGLDGDGNYLATEAGAGTHRLVGVDRTSGAYTPSLDLAPYFGPGARLEGVAAAAGPDVFVGASDGGFAVVHRASGSTVEVLPSLNGFDDLQFVESSTTDAPPPRPAPVPTELRLLPAMPNPFRAGTTLRFTLPRSGPVSLEVFDLHGRRVNRLVRGERGPGEHAVEWDGRDAAGNRLGAGLYLARLTFGAESRRTKVLLAR